MESKRRSCFAMTNIFMQLPWGVGPSFLILVMSWHNTWDPAHSGDDARHSRLDKFGATGEGFA
jgi:hypothetical protein